MDADNSWLNAAAMMRARGVSYRQIGKRLGHDQETVALKLRANPAMIERYVYEIGDPLLAFARFHEPATEAYADALEPDADPQLRLTAARDVMDRLYGKPRIVADSAPSAAVTIQVYSDGGPTQVNIGTGAESDSGGRNQSTSENRSLPRPYLAPSQE